MRNIYLWIATAALNMLGILTIKLRNDMYFEEPTLENKRVVSGFRKETMAFSLTYCSAVCLRYDFCECFGFNSMIQTCRIHASCRRNSTFVNNAGWKYYKRAWTRFQRSEYLIGRTKYKWYDALLDCKRRSAKLVEIESAAEDDFINYLAKVELTGESVWFGGNDIVTEGTWVWASTDELFTYSAWATADGQPDDLNDENCLHIYPTFNLKWVDGHCDNQHFYICEREVA